MVAFKEVRAARAVCTSEKRMRRSIAQGALALLCACPSLFLLSVNANAEATPGEPSRPGPTGLPDARVFEQVSPTDKHGNFYDALHHLTFGIASKDGNAVIYPMSGPVGEEASSGLVSEYVSKRTPAHGWQTASATPKPTSEADVYDGPLWQTPSTDFTRFLFASMAPFVSEDPGGFQYASGVNVFISYGPFAEPAWVGKPRISEPIPSLGKIRFNEYSISGASPSLDTVYFAFRGTLVPEDASRQPYVEKYFLEGGRQGPAGFYEWHDGALKSAAALPDGSFNPFGALPASLAPNGVNGFQQANAMDNEVSEDGTRAFFVSPAPELSIVSNRFACEKDPPCSSEAPQLYLREPGPSGEKVSVLVSASHLPGHEGEATPTGVQAMTEAMYRGSTVPSTDVYASSDGSQAFFASNDQLTPTAPAGSEQKIYDYDTNTGTLTYLPGVTPPLVQVSQSGSELLFADRTVTPAELKLWRSGPGGGSVVSIAQAGQAGTNVDQAHISESGSAVVFRTNAAIPGFNDGGGYNQVYRYGVGSNVLDCLSCPPQGIASSENARMSYNNEEEGKSAGGYFNPATNEETRAMSADGKRVFFDTTSALVPQDTNGARDVYEWEDGTIYLISPGSSPEESVYVDNDPTGENVFFGTSSGLVAGDSDEAYDVYDARIPRPGDNPPPEAVPCKGSVCQGSPSVPQLLGEPASEAFDGMGNMTASPARHIAVKSLTREQRLARALKACRKLASSRRRTRCMRRARHRYRAKAPVAHRGNRHHGRGK